MGTRLFYTFRRFAEYHSAYDTPGTVERLHPHFTWRYTTWTMDMYMYRTFPFPLSLYDRHSTYVKEGSCRVVRYDMTKNKF
jgi:hypothetical protein